MTASRFETIQYSAGHFVESAGAIIFELSTNKVFLVQRVENGEWLLAKGRRNAGERRQAAAIREAMEETGYTCRLLPAAMITRAPPAVETGHYPDEPRFHDNVCEPFMVTCRQLQVNADLKVLYWYLGAIDEQVTPTDGESGFSAKMFDLNDAMTALTYELDRDVLRKAIDIFGHTYGNGIGSS